MQKTTFVPSSNSWKKQNYRPFEDILIIAPDFKYEHDDLVHPQDAFWISSKPRGDWRV
jgi:hypothetical protein